MYADTTARRRPWSAVPLDVHVTGLRVVATIIDGLVLGAMYAAMAGLFGSIGQEGERANYVARMPVVATIAYGLLAVLYYLLLEGYRGQTLGKMLVGIEVVDEAGRRPGMTAIAIRTLLRLVDGILGYLVAFVTVLATDRRQRLGDLAARTLVVRRR